MLRTMLRALILCLGLWPVFASAQGTLPIALVQQMTEHSDVNCGVSTTAAPVFQYGPYISALPVNPVAVTPVTGITRRRNGIE